MPSTDDEEFCKMAERGEVSVDHHDKMMRIAFVYHERVEDNIIFDVIDRLHTRGWSFGQGDLKFNRTLDLFYIAQISAGIYYFEEDEDIPIMQNFELFYAYHHKWLNQDVWKQFYSPSFLAQPMSARFYRLPDLQELSNITNPIGDRREKGTAPFTKLPRWAHIVSKTCLRQKTLSIECITQIALSTLKESILRLRKDYPSIHPFSETQARFWLKEMHFDYSGPLNHVTWKPDQSGVDIAQGRYDLWGWESHYSKERWESVDASYLEPDLVFDETRVPEVYWCGMPDGGAGWYACCRGWDPELGSEAEIVFLAEIAVKETEGIDLNDLNYEVRSHTLLRVLYIAFETGTERENQIKELKQRFVSAGRIDEDKAMEWIQQALIIMEPYVHKSKGWPVSEKERGELLGQILMDNGQLFARWKLAPSCKEFNFSLKPGKHEKFHFIS